MTTAKLGRWPALGFPISPLGYKRGVQYTICTHWQAGVTVTVGRVRDVEAKITEGINDAISILESCRHTDDAYGLRALALRELRAGRPAIMPHPLDIQRAIGGVLHLGYMPDGVPAMQIARPRL